ncbi:MAG: LacI family DNA-binding transcriptional regulator [Chloroflexota bacterium]
MNKSTISDVAREADVSKSTVSRVINDVPNVDPELRERVLVAIDKLDYQPSRAARTLKKDLKDVVGFLVPSISDTIFGDVMQGAEDYAYEKQMGILPYSTADDLERQQRYLDGFLAERVAGLVVVPAPQTDPQVLHTIQAQGIPIVLLDRKLTGFEADYIGSDNIQGAHDAVTHLIEEGYTRIATIAGSQQVSTGVDRLTGYRTAMAEHNLTIQPDWIQFGNFNKQDSYQAFQNLLQLDKIPEAIFIANDAMTISVLRAVRDLGICIPDDLAIAGFDELLIADLLTPALTTIEQAAESLGQEALQLLFDRIQYPNRPTRIVQIPTKINIRESSLSKSS